MARTLFVSDGCYSDISNQLAPANVRVLSCFGCSKDIFSSLDGKQLAVHQAALSRETWISLAPSFWPLFHNASIAYRRMASFKLQLSEDIPELVEDASHVAEQLNNLTF